MAFAILGVYIAIAFVTDARKSIIPNYLTVAACLLGLAFHGIIAGWNGLLAAFIGLSVGFALMLPLYLLKAVGAGDVKLFAGIGALAGTPIVIGCMMYAILFAGIIGMGVLLRRKQLLTRLADVGRMLWCMLLLRDFRTVAAGKSGHAVTFPFMYAVAPAVAMAFADNAIL